jgi:hypothetical protein
MATGKKNARGRIVDRARPVAEYASHRQGGAHSISTEPAPSSLRRDRASDRFGSSSAQSIRNFWLPISTLLSVQRCIAPTVTGVCNAVVARPLSTPLMSSSTDVPLGDISPPLRRALDSTAGAFTGKEVAQNHPGAVAYRRAVQTRAHYAHSARTPNHALASRTDVTQRLHRQSEFDPDRRMGSGSAAGGRICGPDRPVLLW